ncbi:MAG TPA: cysteine dioxygenase family protein [Solirubrobacteraceae bacterium]|nr:cysteine dioxygenase family protein [Solirubrobacteraceae bacterium]
MSLTPKQLERFVEALASSHARWEHLVRHADDVRVYEQIWDDEVVNAWLICWSEDQDTGFHDHDESTAAIAVISGQVREDRLRLGSPPTSQVIPAGSSFTVPPEAIHRVLHSGSSPAVTIHAYSPPLVRSGAYRTGEHGELLREVVSTEDELRAEEAIVAQALPA